MDARPILLLTRPRAQSERFAAGLAGPLAALPRVIAPLIEIVPQPLALDPTPYATLIFTSENGVAAFVAASGLRERPAWCVGPRTAAAAADEGFAVQAATAAGGTAEALIGCLRAARPATPLLHLRGAHAVTDLAGRLTAQGLDCDEAVIYAQEELPPSEGALAVLAGSAPVVLPLFSPRSARLAAAAAGQARATTARPGGGPFDGASPQGGRCRGGSFGGAKRAPLHAVAISRAAAELWCAARPDEEGSVTVAPRPDAEGMIEALTGAVRRLSA